MACQRNASANRNVWANDIENIVMALKKQMFVLQKCALDLTMSFRKYDLTRPGCDPNVKSGLLDAVEFERALAAQGVFLSTKEIQALVRAFGTDEPGYEDLIQYDILGESLREGMNDRRQALVRRIYQQIYAHLPVTESRDPVTGEKTKVVADMTMEFLLKYYHADMHPMVLAGAMTAAEAMRQMKDGLENGPMDADGDGCVDEDEFVAFYDDISAGIPSNDYFCYVAECVWDIQECPDANPIETYRRERPRTTPSAKVALEMHRAELAAAEAAQS